MPKISFQTSGTDVEFPDGEDVNLLRTSLRYECGIPWKCATGLCGTDRVLVVEGAEHLSPPRRREKQLLGDLLDDGVRLACQTYVSGPITIVWDPDQKSIDEDSRAGKRLRAQWLGPDEQPARWHPTTITVDELTRRRKLKVETPEGDLVLLWHDDGPHALANICVHQERELAKGSVLNGRLVCPGHQWAFDVETGFCRERDRTQPVHATRIVDGLIEVDLDPRPG